MCLADVAPHGRVTLDTVMDDARAQHPHCLLGLEVGPARHCCLVPPLGPDVVVLAGGQCWEVSPMGH